MNADLSRFILLSAALHLGVLAAWGTAAPRPPVWPATLSVALYEEPPAPIVPRRHDGGAEQAVLSSHRHSPASRDPRKAVHSDPALTTAHIPAAGHDEAKPSIDPPQEQPAAAMGTPAPLPENNVQPRHAAKVIAEDGQVTDTAPPRPADARRLASQLESRLRQAIAPYFVYPALARRNGWQGQVEVGLRVEADGRLSHVRITRSSGYRVLDSAALTTLNGIDILPGAAGWLGGRHFDMVLPIEYRLVGGQG
jgi:protein TonB